jgi:trimeric autotransporter adhesin
MKEQEVMNKRNPSLFLRAGFLTVGVIPGWNKGIIMLRFIGSVTGLTLLMVACGGGSGGGSAPPPAFTVRGAVSGLAGTGLILRDNGGDDRAVAVDGAIEFSTKIANGATYSVTVFTQPTSPAQTCVVTNGSGTMGSSDVTNVAVSCTLDRFTGFVSGSYFYTDISSIDASSGPVVYDGVGGYSGSYVLNTSGVISSGSISGSYTAAIAGALTLDGHSGAVSTDGNTIVSANLQAGSTQSVDVAIKQGQTNFTNADFTGIYQVVSVSSSVSSIVDSGSTLTLTADGAGSYSGNLVQNNSGVNSAVSGTYSVAADGALTMTPASGSPLSGGISADGKTLVLSQLTAGQPSAFAVGIKQGQTNFTKADVLGTYNIVNLGGLMTLDFDGAGNFSGTTTYNRYGTIDSSSANGTYNVAADGTLTVTFLHPCIKQYDGCHGVSFTWGVSSDGNTLVLSYLNLPGGSALTGVGVGVRW